MRKPKWREDALRRSRKNEELRLMQNKYALQRKRRGSRKSRFDKVCADLLKKIEDPNSSCTEE